jgi:hypothetical protein
MTQATKLIARGRLVEIKTEIEKLNLLVESDLDSILLIISTPYKSASSIPVDKLCEVTNRLSNTVKQLRTLEAEAEKLEA